MLPYANHSGQAGVTAYETGPDWIKLKFEDGSVYLYTYESNGRKAIEAMKKRAAEGIGLTTFINQQLHGRFAPKLPQT